MNRTGAVPQSLRGMPGGFGGQQSQHAARAGGNRLPNGKLAIPANNASGWAFGGVGPMTTGGIQNPTRQLGAAASFAQSLSGSTPATPLDLSEFPQLSNSAAFSGAANQGMWAGQTSRNVGGPMAGPRTPATAMPQSQQDDLFSPSSRLPTTQDSFRFGNQASFGPAQQTQASGSGDDFPPLNRNGNGRDRVASLMPGLSLNDQGPSLVAGQSSGSGNGLLNAITANTRASEARSPVGTRPSGQASMTEDDARQKANFHEDGAAPQQSLPDGPAQSIEIRNPIGAIGNDASNNKGTEVPAESSSTIYRDPLAGMSEADKWGIKGLLTLMAKYPSYHALIHGINPADLGLDLSSEVRISEQIFSLTSHEPPRQPQPKFNLPECYTVRNTQPIEQKVTNFNEETLLFMFYSNPQDRHQYLAAQQLYQRGWRWHKEHRFWLTKDLDMQPIGVAPDHERGYYVVWDAETWAKVRKELTVYYADLETFPELPSGPHS